MSLDVVKDFLGLIGALAMAVPFFKDFIRRLRRDEVRSLKRVFAPFAKALDKAEVEHTAAMEKASNGDLGFMICGVILLASSFGVSLYISAHHSAASCG